MERYITWKISLWTGSSLRYNYYHGNDNKEYADYPVAILSIMGPSRSGKSFYIYFVSLYLEVLKSKHERGF